MNKRAQEIKNNVLSDLPALIATAETNKEQHPDQYQSFMKIVERLRNEERSEWWIKNSWQTCQLVSFMMKGRIK